MRRVFTYGTGNIKIKKPAVMIIRLSVVPEIIGPMLHKDNIKRMRFILFLVSGIRLEQSPPKSMARPMPACTLP